MTPNIQCNYLQQNYYQIVYLILSSAVGEHLLGKLLADVTLVASGRLFVTHWRHYHVTV